MVENRDIVYILFWDWSHILLRLFVWGYYWKDYSWPLHLQVSQLWIPPTADLKLFPEESRKTRKVFWKPKKDQRGLPMPSGLPLREATNRQWARLWRSRDSGMLRIHLWPWRAITSSLWSHFCKKVFTAFAIKETSDHLVVSAEFSKYRPSSQHDIST